MAECPQKGDASDLCPEGVCQGYGRESVAGGSRLIDHCMLTGKHCDATKRDWDGPLSPYCWRFQSDRAEAAEAKLKRVREIAEGYSRATAGGRMPLYAKLCAEIGGSGWDLVIGAEYVADTILAALDAPKGETGVVTFRAQTIADVLLGDYRKKGMEIEKLCTQAVARDPFCREYIKERFALLQHIARPAHRAADGRDSPPCVIFQDLSFWRRARLAWRLLWMRGGV